MNKGKSKVENFRQSLAEEFLKVLEEDNLQWKKGWNSLGIAPFNAVTGREYKGINRIQLFLVGQARGYKDVRWLTFNQIADRENKYYPNEKWTLKKGSKSSLIEFWFPYDIENRKSITWEEHRAYLRSGREPKEFTIKAVYYNVFNAEQVEGIPELVITKNEEVNQAEIVDKISKNMNVNIINENIDRAYYSPFEDRIHLSLKENFINEYEYNSTALHELAHATGHSSRLNRDILNKFGTEDYAYEELVAEMTSCFLSTDLAVEQSEEHISNHKAYIQSWIKAIKDDKDVLIKAVKEAQEVASYLDYKAELITDIEYTQITGKELPVEDYEITQKNKISKELDVKNIEKEKSLEMESKDFNKVATSIPKEIKPFFDLDEINEIPLENILRNYGIEVKGRGKDLWCTIRNEKTPSCKIYTTTNTFCDFGNSNFGGNGIELVKFLDNCTAEEAIQKIANMFNISPIQNYDFSSTINLTNKQYAEIGIAGDMASKNISFNITDENIQESFLLSQKTRISMNTLAIEDTVLYHNILKDRALKYIDRCEKDYFADCFRYIRINEYYQNEELPQNDKYFYEKLLIEIKKDLHISAATLNESSSILEKAIINKEMLDYKKEIYNVDMDITKIEKGKISFQVAGLDYREMKNIEKATGEKLSYVKMNIYDYFKNEDIKQVPHSAFISGKNINIACTSKDKELILENNITSIKR